MRQTFTGQPARPRPTGKPTGITVSPLPQLVPTVPRPVQVIPPPVLSPLPQILSPLSPMLTATMPQIPAVGVQPVLPLPILQTQLDRPVLTSLDSIYNVSDTNAARTIYRELVNDPNIAYNWSLDHIRNSIIDEAFKKGLLPADDVLLHTSKSMKFILSIPEAEINRLLAAYKIPIVVGDTKALKALKLYRHGVGFHDLLFAFSNEPDMITGNIGHIPKPGETIGSGIYDIRGKVNKDQNNFVDPIPGNPYSYLSLAQIRFVIENRDINIPRGKHQIVFITTLTNYDNVLPDWIDRVRDDPLGELNRPELYVRAGLNQINLSKINTAAMSPPDIRHLIRLGIIILANREPPKPPTKKYQAYESKEKLNYENAYNTSIGGYILNETNIGFPFSIFGHHKNRVETLGYFAELALYPPNVTAEQYNTLQESNPTVIRTLLKEKYKSDDVEFLNDNFLLFIASRGYMLPDPNLNKIKERYNKISKYPPSLLVKIRRLYKLRQIPESEVKYPLARVKVNPLETIIISYKIDVIDNPKLSTQNKNKLSMEYGNRVGMVIPPSIEHKIDYFWNNVTKYRHVLTRPSTIGPIDKNLLSTETLNGQEVKILLRNYTDQEIFGYVGVYLPYTSRENLLDNIIDIRRARKFFIPTVRGCTNPDTITTFDDTNDPAVFIIGYGTIFEYYCYNFDDFMESFREFPVEGLEGITAYRFRIPNQPGQDFSLVDIRLLIPLLELYPNIPGVEEMITNIRAGMIRAQEMTNYDRTLLGQLNQLNADKQLVRSWLHQLFTIGMYMRRWKGPPRPYPLRRADTHGPDPNENVNRELQTLGYYPVMQNLDGTYPPFDVGGITSNLSNPGQLFVNDLRAIEYQEIEGVRVPRQETRTIGYYLNRVRKADMCIRIASTKFIGTGSYYLRVFFGEDIPGFDPTQMDLIA